MKILPNLLFFVLLLSAIQCFADGTIEFRLAYEDSRPDTYVYKDKYCRTLFIENKPSIVLSDLLQVNVIVKDNELPPLLNSSDQDSNISIPDKQISFEVIFNDGGKNKLTKITSENIGNLLVITINGEIAMTPTIQDTIDTGEAFITTDYTENEARAFANKVNMLINSD